MIKPQSVSWSQALARRLERQGLSSPLDDASPAAVVAAMCGAHAQVLSAAEYSIALRHSSLTRTDIHNALWADRTLIKTFGPRGTVHLLPTKDLPAWLGALNAVPWPEVNLPKEARLTPNQTEKVIAAISAALDDAKLSIDELGKEVIARAGSWAGDLTMAAFQTYWPRWRLAIGAAAFRGVLCFAPNRGRNVTYTNPRRWLPKLKLAAEKNAVRKIIHDYLHAYGPATPQHFAKWFAVPSRWAAEMFEDLDLEPIELEGEPAYVVAGDAKFQKEKPRGVRLLPYYDAYMVASHPRARLYPGRAAQRAMARGQAGNFPVLLIDGVVAGVWHQRHSGKNLYVTVEPLGKLSVSQRRGLEAQVTHIGEFLQAKPTLTIGKVNVGAHA